MKLIHQLMLVLMMTAAPAATLFATEMSQAETNAWNDYVRQDSRSKGYLMTSSLATIKSYAAKKTLENGSTQVGICAPKLEVTIVYPGSGKVAFELNRADDVDGEPQNIGSFQLSSTAKDEDGDALPKLGLVVVDTRTGTKAGQEELFLDLSYYCERRELKTYGPYAIVVCAAKEASAQEFNTFLESLNVNYSGE